MDSSADGPWLAGSFAFLHVKELLMVAGTMALFGRDGRVVPTPAGGK